jgi:hypothetical protein
MMNSIVDGSKPRKELLNLIKKRRKRERMKKMMKKMSNKWTRKTMRR